MEKEQIDYLVDDDDLRHNYRELKSEVEMPEPWTKCSSGSHWINILVWGKCKECGLKK